MSVPNVEEIANALTPVSEEPEPTDTSVLSYVDRIYFVCEDTTCVIEQPKTFRIKDEDQNQPVDRTLKIKKGEALNALWLSNAEVTHVYIYNKAEKTTLQMLHQGQPNGLLIFPQDGLRFCPTDLNQLSFTWEDAEDSPKKTVKIRLVVFPGSLEVEESDDA